MGKEVLDEISAGIDAGKVTVEGDNASLAMTIEDSEASVHLLRLGGQWKIDTAAYFHITGAITPGTAQRIARQNQVETALAGKISAGIAHHQISTMHEAMIAFVTGTVAAETGADHTATTQPAPATAPQ